MASVSNVSSETTAGGSYGSLAFGSSSLGGSELSMRLLLYHRRTTPPPGRAPGGVTSDWASPHATSSRPSLLVSPIQRTVDEPTNSAGAAMVSLAVAVTGVSPPYHMRSDLVLLLPTTRSSTPSWSTSLPRLPALLARPPPCPAKPG